jgi:predicted DNA-binding transcriptional regulator YafY
MREAERQNLDDLTRAVDERLKVRVAYRDADGGDTERTIWPLALHFWGRVWTLAAWCELRDDFRTFRVDRAERISLGEERYPRTSGRTLEDYLARMTGCP